MSARRIVPILMISLFAMPTVRADDWPQWLGPQRDGVWRETGLLSKFPAGGPKVRWRTPIGEGYSGPSVAGGKVYVTDRIRTKGANNPDNAFKKAPVAGVERVLCLNEADGKILWTHEYPCEYRISYASGPRTSPVVAGGKVYTLGAMGHLYCLNANDGKVIWSKDLLKEYKMLIPTWGFAGHPLLDGDRLICLVGGEGSVAVAFHKDTGKEIWKALSAAEPGYAPPTIITPADGRRQLILWHPESINSLNPETGAVYWSHKFNKKPQVRAGMTIPTPRLDGDKLFFTCFYDGALMLKLKGLEAPTVIWQGQNRSEMPDGTDALQCVMNTPVIKDGFIYGACSYGEFRCIDAATGKRIWETYKPTTGKSVRWGHTFTVAQGDRFILFNELGDLILAKLSPKGYQEIDRANILTPTNTMAPPPGRRVIWSHPAFANRSVYARNDKEIICVSMAE